MTAREIVLALLGLIGNDTNLLIGSLILLKRQVSFETIIECQKEMSQMVRNLHALSEPRAKAQLSELLEMLRKEGE